MILKTIGIKNDNSYGRLIDYVLRPDAVLLDANGKPVVITHNVFGTREQIIEQFKNAERSRLNSRKDNNVLLHTILSLSGQDRSSIKPSMLEELSRAYIEKLNPNGLYFGAIHMEDNPHSHILVSGSDLLGKATRLSKQEFRELKQDLQALQMELYPELTHSIANHGRGGISISDAEYQIEHSGQVSRKQELKELLSASYELSRNREEFFNLLQEDDLGIYERGGEAKGISDGDKHYRFSTMNIDLGELDRRELVFTELENLENGIKSDIEKDPQLQEREMSLEEEQRMKELDELENH